MPETVPCSLLPTDKAEHHGPAQAASLPVQEERPSLCPAQPVQTASLAGQTERSGTWVRMRQQINRQSEVRRRFPSLAGDVNPKLPLPTEMTALGPRSWQKGPGRGTRRPSGPVRSITESLSLEKTFQVLCQRTVHGSISCQRGDESPPRCLPAARPGHVLGGGQGHAPSCLTA